MKNFWLSAIYISLLILIVWLANIGELPVGRWLHAIPFGDKLGHFVLVGGCAFILNWSLGCRKFKLSRYPVLLGSAIVFLGFTLEELSQIFIETRAFDLLDLLFNTLGIIVFGYLADWLHNRSEQTDSAHDST